MLDAVERSGVFDRTAFFLVADHGMEESDPSCTGNWADALDDSGVALSRRGLRLHLRPSMIIGIGHRPAMVVALRTLVSLEF